MEQTILQLPMQQQSPSVQEAGAEDGFGIGVIYDLRKQGAQPAPVLLSVGSVPPPLPLTAPPAMSEGVAIGRRRREILKALVACQDLTIDQLQRWLRLSEASIPYLREHLRVLTKGRFVEACAPSKQTLYGRAPNVYSYGPEARKYLRSLGEVVPSQYRPLKERLHKEYPIKHALAVNEVLVNARNLRWETTEDATLTAYTTEKVLNGNPLVIPLPQRKKPYRLSPDLRLVISHALWDFFGFVELNLTEVSQTAWRERVRAYLYSLKAYEERFGTNKLKILVIVQSAIDFPKTNVTELTDEEILERREAAANRQLRRTNLVKWTEQELTALRVPEHINTMFWFTDKRLHETNPIDLFFGRHWHLPYTSELSAPLPPRKAGGS